MPDAQRAEGSWRTIESVKTSIDILHALRELDGAGVTEIANHLSLAKGTVHSHLATLKEEEFVIKEGNTYAISLRFLDFGEYAKNRIPHLDILKQELDALADETGEVVQFLTEEHGRGVYLYKARGQFAVETASYVGKRTALHCTALGKAILSQLPEERVQWIIDRHDLPPKTDNTITDRGELFEELRAIREQGYSTDDEEILRGLRCVASPVSKPDGNPLGAVSIAGPTSRMNGERFHEALPELITSTANVIEIAQRSRQ